MVISRSVDKHVTEYAVDHTKACSSWRSVFKHGDTCCDKAETEQLKSFSYSKTQHVKCIPRATSDGWQACKHGRAVTGWRWTLCLLLLTPSEHEWMKNQRCRSNNEIGRIYLSFEGLIDDYCFKISKKMTIFSLRHSNDLRWSDGAIEWEKLLSRFYRENSGFLKIGQCKYGWIIWREEATRKDSSVAWTQTEMICICGPSNATLEELELICHSRTM